MIRLVLVEDDNLMREWLGRALASRGFHVVRFGRGDEALASILSDTPQVVVSDIRMPGMSGLEMTRHLRARGVDVPVVFMTADPSEEIDSEANTLSTQPVVRKPFSHIAELWAAVDAALTESAASKLADVTGTSHALRTPLTAVRMAFEGLLADRELDAREQHLADIAERNLDRLTSAVEDHLGQLAIAGDDRRSSD